MSTPRSRATALLLALLLPASLAAGQAATPDLPSGAGTVSGRVLHAVTGEPVADVEVVLYALAADGVPGLRRARSDREGRFRFANLSTAAGISYLLGGRHSNVPFPGARVTFPPGETETTADIRLTELTRDPAEVRTSAVEIRMVRDAQGLRVLQRVELTNAGPTTYAVPADQHEAFEPAFSTGLPATIQDFQMPLGVIPDGIARSEAGLAYYGPIYPGRHDLTYSFSLPAETAANGTERFVLSGTLPAGSPVSVLVPEGLGPVIAHGLEKDPETASADGVPHTRFSAVIGADPGAGFRLEITPPPAVVDPEATRITAVQAVLDADDAAIAVRETVTIEVSGASVVLGSEAQPLARLLLPEDATDLRFGTNATGARLIPHPEGGLAAVGTAGPGEWQIEVRYQLAVEELPIRFTRHFDERIPQLSIFIADTGEWIPESDRLHRRRPARTPDLAYMHLEAFEVAPHEPVSVVLDRLPPRNRYARTLGLGVAFALALLAIFWLSLPLRSSAPIVPGEAAVSPSGREREAIVWSIRDLDHDFETGKISDADHREMRESLRARAIELLRQEQAEQAPDTTPTAGEAPTGADPADATAATPCAGCGAPLEAAHRFCPQCGAARS